MVEIKVRYSGMTYVARVRGEKQTASNVMGARWAAEALARKLGHDPVSLIEVQRDLARSEDKVFAIPAPARSTWERVDGEHAAGAARCM